jgi:hypothetical protein
LQLIERAGDQRRHRGGRVTVPSKDRQALLVKRLGLGVAALSAVHFGEVVEAGRDSGMIGSQRLLKDCQRLLGYGNSIVIAALAIQLEHLPI